VEKYLVDGGIILIKFWLEVSDREQKRRFEARITDPVRQWKLSPIDLPSRSKWFECSRARDMMLKATDTEWAPWYLIRSDDKKRARLNCITHLLKLLQVSLTIKSTAPKTSHLSIVVSFKGCQLLRGGLLESHH
jgi:polyphosphate kinase 2 (PPK2 family)